MSTSKGIATVAFQVQSGFTLPQVEMPVAMSEYVRVPLQPGAPGLAVPSDAMVAAVSGISTGAADLGLQANLSSLVFVPISNKGWMAVDDKTVVIYGPEGVTIRDMTDATKSIALTATGISLTFGANSLVIDATGTKIVGPFFHS